MSEFLILRLTKGLWTLVNPEDYEWLSQWKWQASHQSRGTKWYATRPGPDKLQVRMHRVIVQERMGIIIPPGYVVDHINHNSLDNRRINLEVVTQAENMRRSPGWKRKK